jgi:hypothetical protein
MSPPKYVSTVTGSVIAYLKKSIIAVFNSSYGKDSMVYIISAIWAFFASTYAPIPSPNSAIAEVNPSKSFGMVSNYAAMDPTNSSPSIILKPIPASDSGLNAYFKPSIDWSAYESFHIAASYSFYYGSMSFKLLNTCIIPSSGSLSLCSSPSLCSPSCPPNIALAADSSCWAIATTSESWIYEKSGVPSVPIGIIFITIDLNSSGISSLVINFYKSATVAIGGISIPPLCISYMLFIAYLSWLAIFSTSESYNPEKSGVPAVSIGSMFIRADLTSYGVSSEFIKFIKSATVASGGKSISPLPDISFIFSICPATSLLLSIMASLNNLTTSSTP